ncbi:hypothetical protein GGR51DRAFT_502137 [Nemania sp. FL0031]|nr:hypothetical protein GGR51DRAFT_502137 [Nemania sp. FL0031]
MWRRQALCYISQRAEQHQFHGPAHTVCRAIDNLGNSLQPYFAVINSFVSSNPEIAGLIWGSVQLMLKLCHNYSTFLEKLAALLMEIATELDIFKGAAGLGSLSTVEDARNLAYDEDVRDRIVLAMSRLYTDLFELCHYICNVFSATERSRVKKLQNIARMLWTPFDQQFGEFRKRLALHRRILATAIDEYTAKTTEKTYNGVDQLVKSYHTLLERQKSFSQGYQDDLLARKIGYIKAWLSPPLWQSVLEDLKVKRFPLTSTWILQHPSYQWWLGGPQDMASIAPDTAQSSERGLRGRTLMIHGKPGYGKSTLCTTIIDELSIKASGAAEELEPRQLDVPMAFYMFDKRRPDAQTSENAMRAVLTQLLHHSKFNSRLVDFALLLKDVKGSGQLVASATEIWTLLRFFLEKLQSITLIFDGLDECYDAGEFLRQLSQITSTTVSRILLLSRPNIDLDGTWAGESRVLHLGGQENLEDIKTYLSKGLRQLIDSEKLLTDEPMKALVSNLAQRSHSMFLWASIMINYLDSDFLSPQDREDAMSEMCEFEELDGLYVSILNRLYLTCRGAKARQNSQRLFQWVFSARRALCIEELRFALGIKAGSITNAKRLMKSFYKILPKMTGALLEIGQDKCVRPIHSSFLDFFSRMQETCASSTSPHLRCDFKVDMTMAQHHVAIDCLSYLLHDAPKERLSRVTQTPCNLRAILDRYPLLLYVVEFWAVHAAEATQASIIQSGQPTPANHYSNELVLKYINNFMDNKSAVTVWIEASWRFGIPPDLHQLPDVLNTVQPLNMPQLTSRLAIFSSELRQLNTHWGPRLQEDPNEIWEPSISAFMKPQSWISSNQATVAELDSPRTAANRNGLEPPHEPILISSQSSSDGSEVGWIKLWPSRYYVENIHSTDDPDINRMSSEWVVSYAIKRIVDGLLIHHIIVQLPQESVLSIANRARRSYGRFEFPVAFSHDLRQVIVLTYLIRIHTSSAGIAGQGFSLQALNLDQTSTQKENDTARVPFPLYSFIFSPNSRYIAVLGGNSISFISMHKQNQALILEDRSGSWETPAFQVIAVKSLATWPHTETRIWAFHPTQPVIGITCLGETALWFFEHPARWVRIPAGSSLDNLAFSNCGHYLHGIERTSRAFRQIPIRRYFEEEKTITSRGGGPGMEVVAVHQSEQLSLAQETKAETILTPDSITFDHFEGRSQLCALRHLNDAGLVTLKKFRDDGTIQVQHLTRLPRSSSLKQSYATLVSKLNGSESDPIQLVINKSMEDTYSYGTKPDINLPLLITRNAESIPRWTGKHKLALEFPEDTHTPQRRRLT